LAGAWAGLVLGAQVAAAAPADESAPTESSAAATGGLTRWLDPATAPFIPIPEIDTDPYSGLTLGVIPTLLRSNAQQQIASTCSSATVLPGVLPGLPSTGTRFPGLLGLGAEHELQHRLMLTYDTRDSGVIPTDGARYLLYAGFVSREFGSSVSYSYLNGFGTRVSLELAPFVDAGKVFANPGSSPVSHLHHAVGLGVRGVASPYVVGYVDVGYGQGRAAVFSGINYPF
jgi:hypothetical protein